MAEDAVILRVKAKMQLRLGKQPDGRILSFEPGDIKEVRVTPVIQNIINARGLEVVEGDDGDEKLDDIAKYIAIKGLGPQLSRAMFEKFGPYEDFKEKITLQELIDFPGIGERIGKQILEEIRLSSV